MNVSGPGTRTVVVAVAAPLWASTEAAHESAAFDGTSYQSYRAWMSALARQPSLRGRLDTVALCGEPVRLLGSCGPLLRVELPAQPDGLTGYIGFMRAEHIGPDHRETATHVVAERHALATTGDADAGPLELAPGTTVQLLAYEGATWAQVLLSSGASGRWPRWQLRPLGVPASAAEVFRIAACFLGVPYVWGGTDAAGIDCSGLVHVAARIGGHVVPRDAHHQWAATRIDAGWDDLDAGDILFFGSSATLEGIDHVGLYAGNGRMLHAPEEGRSVSVEPISDRARKRSVGFGRLDQRPSSKVNNIDYRQGGIK